MVQNTNTLTWQPIAAEDDEWAAVLSLDTATDTLFRIGIVGAAPGGDAANIRPTYIVVDNMANNGLVNISFGPFVYVVPQFTRKTYKIPISLRSLLIGATVGIVGIALVKSQYAPDDANFFDIQQNAGVFQVQFLPRSYNTNSAQVAADQNSWTTFDAVAADITYTLIAGGVAPLAAGWFQFVRNEGTKKASIKPAGGDVLNGVFTNAAPLILSPGDSGQLQFDGTSWHFIGHTTFITAAQTLAFGGGATIAHGLGIAPSAVNIYLQCITAGDGNFGVGDRVEPWYMNTPNMNQNVPWLFTASSATNLIYRQVNTIVNPNIVDKTTGALVTITLARWELYFKLHLWQ